MKRAREPSIKRKTIRAFIIMIIALIPVGVFMILGGVRFARDRDNTHMKQKIGALADLVANENEMYNAAVEVFDQNLAAHISMMTVSLKQLISQEGSFGPRMLSNGFVAELRGEDVILPEGMPEGQLHISRSAIEQSLASGRLRTRRFTVQDAASDSASTLSDAQSAAGASGIGYPPGEILSVLWKDHGESCLCEHDPGIHARRDDQQICRKKLYRR